jgi:proteic killer suppression protein
MRLEYLDDKIQSFCLEQKKAIKELGPDAAKKLRSRLSDLKAASNVSELIAGRPHPYKGTSERRFSLDLAGGKRLLFIPTTYPPPLKGDGGIDWRLVKEITIVFIGDNHD